MRKKTFNQSNKTKSSYLFLNKPAIINIKRLITVVVFFLTFNGFSQTNSRIVERTEFLTSIRNGSLRNLDAYDQVLDLMDGVQSSIYLLNNRVSVYGQMPICMYTDLSSLVLASGPDLKVNNIEMVTIKIGKPSELTSSINLTTVSRFKNVKYIYLRIGFNFDLSQLTQLIKNCDPKCIVIYSVEKGA